MKLPRASDERLMTRILRDPVWQGIGAIAGIISLAVPLAAAIGAFIPANKRVLLALQVTALAAPTLLALSLTLGLLSVFIIIAWRNVRNPGRSRNPPLTHKEPLFPVYVRIVAGIVALVILSGMLVGATGYTHWISGSATKTVVLIADFLDTDGIDSRHLTRDLIKQMSESLASFDDIELRVLGSAIKDDHNEGNVDARSIGDHENADIVIWGDYVTEPEFVASIHFDLLSNPQTLLTTESTRILGNDQVQAVATAQQQLAVPTTHAFNLALGEHLGALVAYASGVTLYQNKAYSDAARLLDKASSIYGNPLASQFEPVIHYMRGSVYFFLDDYVIAEAELTAALDLLSSAPKLSELIQPQTVLSNRAAARVRQGDYGGAVSDFDKAIALDPEYALNYYDRGALLHIQGDLVHAISNYDKAIALDPQYAIAYKYRGAARHDLGDLAGALSDYNEVIALAPEDPETYFSRATIRESQGDLAGALNDFSAAIDIDPIFINAYINRGGVYAKLGNLTGAKGDYDMAIALDPNHPVPYANRAAVRHHLGDLAGAASDLDQAIALNPSYAAAYTDRGALRGEQGNYAGAISDLDRAINLAPELPDAYFNRGYTAKQLGDAASAIADFTRYLELAPKAPDRPRVEQMISELNSQMSAK